MGHIPTLKTAYFSSALHTSDGKPLESGLSTFFNQLAILSKLNIIIFLTCRVHTGLFPRMEQRSSGRQATMILYYGGLMRTVKRQWLTTRSRLLCV